MDNNKLTTYKRNKHELLKYNLFLFGAIGAYTAYSFKIPKRKMLFFGASILAVAVIWTGYLHGILKEN